MTDFTLVTLQALGAAARAARVPFKTAAWAAVKRFERTGSLIDSALMYCACGYPIFPVDPDDRKPLITDPLKRATTDERVIRQWWTIWPYAEVGIAQAELPPELLHHLERVKG
jgi:hypothetical protein